MSFGDLLAQPLQRLTRYPMLLRSIMKGAGDPQEQAELASCLESLEKVRRDAANVCPLERTLLEDTARGHC